jgi:hypothetical protein
MLIACAIRTAVPWQWRRWIAVCIVFWAAMSFPSFLHHGGENWADAMRKVRETVDHQDVPVLVASGFVEASDARAIANPRLHEVLFAPLLLYPPPGKIVPLPYRLNDASVSYLESILPTVLSGGRFVLVERESSYKPWLRGRLAPLGYRSGELGSFDSLHVSLFTRGPDSAPGPDSEK